MAVKGQWMVQHLTIHCVNSFLGHSVAAPVPMVHASAVQSETVMWDSGLRLKQEPNSWVDCYFWIELVWRTELLIKAFGKGVHNWRVLYVYIHIFFFYHFRKTLSHALSLSLDLLPIFLRLYLFMKKPCLFWFFSWQNWFLPQPPCRRCATAQRNNRR